MQPTFNLIRERWIPCIRADDSSDMLSLHDVLAQAHLLQDLVGDTPIVTAASYRTLLALLYRVFSVHDEDDWAALWGQGQFDMTALDTYFSNYYDCFWLFHPTHPFMQSTQAKGGKKIVSTLSYHIASTSSPTLFNHATDDQISPFTPSEATRHLLAVLSYSLSGLSGAGPNYVLGPVSTGLIFLVHGATVFETLLFNLLPYSTRTPIINTKRDKPSWERDDPCVPERNQPDGYMDYLTWPTRRILLIPNEEVSKPLGVQHVVMSHGLKLNDDTLLDPLQCYKASRNGYVSVKLDSDRALWRDSHALFQERTLGVGAGDVRPHPPMGFAWVTELVLDRKLPFDLAYRYMALGMRPSRQGGNAELYRAEIAPLPLPFLQQDALREKLRLALDIAEKAGAQLNARKGGAAYKLIRLTLDPSAEMRSRQNWRGPDDPQAEFVRFPQEESTKKAINGLLSHLAISRRYWSLLELHFTRTQEAILCESSTALSDWRVEVCSAARMAFSEVARSLGTGTRTLRAVALAEMHLSSALSDLNENSTTLVLDNSEVEEDNA